MAMAKRNEGGKISSDINVTPMVDVMLVLLIIFMVVMPLLPPHGYPPITLAKTEHPVAMPNADNDDSIVLAVTRDGRVYLGREQIGLNQLSAKVTERLQRMSDKSVFVKADAHARYGAVVEVVDDLRSANVENLGLLTQESKPSGIGNKAGPKT